MDYCTDSSSSTWECARAITLGIISVVTWLVCLIALHRVLRAHAKRLTFALNIAMLFLSSLQTAVDWIELLGKREARLQLMSMTLRSFQTNLACAAYASFILENRNVHTRKFWCIVFPVSLLAFATTLIIFILSCVEEEVTCEHPLWLVMAVLQLAMSLVFVIIGLVASNEVNHLMASTALSGELVRKRGDLWFLMATFFLASLAQVTGDAWRQDLYRNGSSCRFHETHVEEFVRTILFVVSFDVPVWGILFVFYYRQRHNLDPRYEAELPSVQLLQWEEGLHAEAEDELTDVDDEDDDEDGANDDAKALAFA